jgi:hypothetical protein
MPLVSMLIIVCLFLAVALVGSSALLMFLQIMQ